MPSIIKKLYLSHEESNRSVRIIKLAAVVLLLFAVTQPFASCSHKVDEAGKIVPPLSETYSKVVTEYFYPIQYIRLHPRESWRFIFFVWPLLIVIVQFFTQKNLIRFVIWLSEPVLLAVSAFYVYIESHIFVEPERGFYFIELSYVIYGIAWCLSLIDKLRQHDNPEN